MNSELWTKADAYLAEQLIETDAALDAALAASREAGLPAIAVSPLQGKFLHLLARMQQPRRILEVGTLGGYSTIWLARALAPGGRLITLELQPHHAAVAQSNLQRAGVAANVEIRIGPALDALAQLSATNSAPFDFVFIDADKAGIPDYFEFAVKLSRPGAAIVVDNVVRAGNVADASSTDPAVLGVRRFHEQLRWERRVTASTLQTVGLKGHDGFTLVLVN